jgi:phosphoribosyl-AMP cyclohydrolase / phosphoribosyl-ATP pyrophosphohydrolase
MNQSRPSHAADEHSWIVSAARSPLRPDQLAYGRNGLLPVVLQHGESGTVLCIGYTDRFAVERTLESRQPWLVDAPSGRLSTVPRLVLTGMRVDEHANALLYLCSYAEGSEAESSFGGSVAGIETGPESYGEALATLFATIKCRQTSADLATSYVARLLAGGVDRTARKVGEEATEVVIAAKNGDHEELAREMADLWFHSLVLLAQQGVSPDDVWAVLRERRRGTSRD